MARLLDRTRPYLEPYRNAVQREGPSFAALLWRSPQTQRLRFEALAAMTSPAGRRIADLGCGRADFLAYLMASGRSPLAYTGVEAIPELARCSREALARAGHAAAGVLQADFATDGALFQRLVASGVSCLVFSGSLNTFEQAQALEVLSRAWAAVGALGDGVLAFNFLNGRHPENGAGGECRAFDPVGVLGWAFERTPRVVFRQEYLGGRDAAIAMFAPEGCARG